MSSLLSPPDAGRSPGGLRAADPGIRRRPRWQMVIGCAAQSTSSELTDDGGPYQDSSPKPGFARPPSSPFQPTLVTNRWASTGGRGSLGCNGWAVGPHTGDRRLREEPNCAVRPRPGASPWSAAAVLRLPPVTPPGFPPGPPASPDHATPFRSAELRPANLVTPRRSDSRRPTFAPCRAAGPFTRQPWSGLYEAAPGARCRNGFCGPKVASGGPTAALSTCARDQRLVDGPSAAMVQPIL